MAGKHDGASTGGRGGTPTCRLGGGLGNHTEKDERLESAGSRRHCRLLAEALPHHGDMPEVTSPANVKR